MAFSFGGNDNNAPAPAPGGFSFGSTAPAPAPAGGVAPSFSFGNTPAPASGGAAQGTAPAAPASTGGFSFGGSIPAPTPAAPAPATGGSSLSNPPAPAAPSATAPAGGGGLSFGSAAAAPASNNSGGPAPSPGGFSFGGNAPAPSAPAPAGGFSALGNNAAATTAPGAIAAPHATLQAQDFDSVFPNLQVWQKIQKSMHHASSEGELLGAQELQHCISTNNDRLQPKAAEWTPPNGSLRQQLASNPTISISYSSQTTSTKLSPKNLERILRLATDLRISEAHAVSLYAHVSEHLEAISSLPSSNLMQAAGMDTKKYAETSLVARNFYFYQQGLQLHTLLYLLQSRFQNSASTLQATDGLLQAGLLIDLIKVLREYTQRIQQLQQEVAASKEQSGSVQQLAQGFQQQQLQALSNSNKQPPNFANTHLLFCQQERQVAAECLFFIAYHTQLTPPEMAALLDVIKDLSAMLPTLCPFTNVPSPYEPMAPTAAAAPNGWPSSSNAPFTYALKEKDPLLWQKQMVTQTYQSGQPHVLQCVSLLIVAAVSAMETRQVLYDRDIHGPNSFGRGNQFLPPSEMAPTIAQELQSRLEPAAANVWHRKDIWGILAAAYALLLRSAPMLSQSPRAGASSSQQQCLRHTARECLVLPSSYKSFSFCRLTMIPALQRLPSTAFANFSEFGLAVLAECFSNYLEVLAEGSMPMSRSKYEKEETEELNLRRAQSAQHSQFLAWSGKKPTAQEAIPAAVDLFARPDCLDDIIALASSLSELGPEYAQHFWGRCDNGGLVPSRAMVRLGRSQAVDDSLMPTYFSFLAALSNDTASANAVYHHVAGPSDAAADGASNSLRMNWISLIFNLRWYAQELSSYDANTVSKPASSGAAASSSNTSYYYNLDGNALPSNFSGATSSSSSGQAASRSNKPKELSEMARFRVSSHLALIQKVAQHSASAQTAILSITLPVGDAMAAGGDDSLLVLFKLAIAPLSPTLRGATLTTIGRLLDTLPGATSEEKSFTQQQAQNAWEYLESCPLLPISLLDQYFNRTSTEASAPVGLSFPPSSTTLSNSMPAVQSIFQKDTRYGLLHEMEYIEARMGWYPSTEGFLQLLESLVCSAGCPRMLGQSWRPRTGCAPYIEYIVDFVLPRALGINGAPSLPFRVQGDRCRLVTRALQVLEAVVSRYKVPTEELQRLRSPQAPPKPVKKALEVLGIPSVVNKVVTTDPTTASDAKESMDDFVNLSMPAVSYSDVNTTGNSTSAAASSPAAGLPRTKSPGFVVLADILSSGGGVIFHALAKVLTDYGGTNGIGSVYGPQSDQMALAFALFGATPPDMVSAKEGAKEGGPTKPLQALLKPLSPLLDQTQLDNASSWRETSIALALRLFCAAAAKEEAFIQAVTAAKETLKIVPVLRFQQHQYGSSNFRVVDVEPSRLTNLLFFVEGSQNIRSSIIDCIGYNASNEALDVDLGSASLSLLFYLQRSAPSQVTLGSSMLSMAVAKRLLTCARRPGSVADMETTSLIFDWILSPLRAGRLNVFVQDLLGLPGSERGGNWKPGKKSYVGSLGDCFDAVLELLQDVEFATSKSTSGIAASCMETVFRLYDMFQGAGNDPTYLKIVLYTAERLRSVKFWKINLLIWLSNRGTMPLKRTSVPSSGDTDANILNCAAWLLKGLAIELKLLVGFANSSILESGLGGMLSPRPLQCKELLSVLFGSEEAVMYKLIEDTPLEKIDLDYSFVRPPVEVLRKAAGKMSGPADVVANYQLVNADFVARSMGSLGNDTDTAPMLKWVEQWNNVASWDCGASHLSNAIYLALSAGIESYAALDGSEGVYQIVGLQATGQTNLLALILHRLISKGGQQKGMDTIFFPAATRDLSNAVLVLAESITSFSENEAPTASELVALAAMLSRTLAYSGVGDEAAVEVPMRHERTTVLASALSALLRYTAHTEPDFVRQYRGDFLAAAGSLSKLCIFRVDSNASEALSVVSVLARSSFGSILDACSGDDEEQMSETFVFETLPKRFLANLLELTATMDENICVLLQTVALQPCGSQILIDGGICTALQAAAKAYLAEEARVSSTLPRSSYNKATLGTPRFLASHLRLLSTLMSAQSSPSRTSFDLAIQATETVAMYKEIILRLCYNFPAEADVLRWFMRCFVQALSLAQSVDHNERHDLLAEHTSKLKRIFTKTKLIDNGILMLCQQLWENPLPQELLLQLPTELLPSEKGGLESRVVLLEKAARQSWWDVLDRMLMARDNSMLHSFEAPIGQSDFWGTKNNKKWDENRFEYGIVAMDILSLGTSLLKRLNRLELVDGSSIARGVYHCSFAAQVSNKIGARPFVLLHNISQHCRF